MYGENVVILSGGNADARDLTLAGSECALERNTMVHALEGSRKLY